MIQITGLWKKYKQDGEEYWTGPFGNCNVMVFNNKYKVNDKQPDLVLYVGKREKKGGPNE